MTTSAPVRAFQKREATLADLPQVCAMFEHFRADSIYAQYGPAHPEVSTPLLERLITGHDSVVIVCGQDDQLVGMIGLIVTPHPMSGERMATELFWWLEPAHRGAGAWLLRRAERWAIAQDAQRILMVSPQSQVVDRIYAALGYSPVETSWQKPLDWFSRHESKPGRVLQGIRVHDGVLADPDAYRAMALQQRFQAVHDGAVTFQRIAACADPTLPMWIVKQYPPLTPTLSFFRQGEQDQAEPHYVHTDASMGTWTGLLYLNPMVPLGDGTAFWRHRPSGHVSSRDISADEALKWFDINVWDKWHSVPAQFNRLVIFPAELYHSRAIPANYGHGDDARLIQVVFGTGVLK